MLRASNERYSYTPAHHRRSTCPPCCTLHFRRVVDLTVIHAYIHAHPSYAYQTYPSERLVIRSAALRDPFVATMNTITRTSQTRN